MGSLDVPAKFGSGIPRMAVSVPSMPRDVVIGERVGVSIEKDSGLEASSRHNAGTWSLSMRAVLAEGKEE